MPNDSTLLHPRTIKSFALREGRLTPRQKDALTNESAHYMLPTETRVDWEKIFPHNKPLTLEIGFGMGHALLENARSYPNAHFVGIEVYRPAIGAVLAELKAQKIDNVRIFYGDAVEILNRCIPDNSFDAVHIFFPDPWPKRRHHKRRLIQTHFVQLLIQKLKHAGKLHLATDWEEYAIHMEQVLSPLETLKNTAKEGLFSNDRENRPLTKYEQRGQRLGHPVWDLIYKTMREEKI